MDSVILRNLQAQARIGPDCWGRDRPQHLLITVFIITTKVAQAGVSDKEEDLMIDYSKISKGILEHIKSRSEPFESLYSLVLELADDVIPNFGNGSGHRFDELKIYAIAPKQFLCADALEIQLFRTRQGKQVSSRDVIQIRNLQANVIVGLNTHERLAKQRLLVDISIEVQQSFKPWMEFLNMEFMSLILDVSHCTRKVVAN
jgi:dihydroneopterin aldolase